MSSRPFSQASAYASQFLNNSFAPYHFQARTGSSGSSEAPLFFSSVDGEAIAVLDEDHGQLLPRSSVIEDGGRTFGQSYYHPLGGRGTIDEADDDEEEEGEEDGHNGLGKADNSYTDSNHGDDAEAASNSTTDPFKRNVGSSNRPPPAAPVPKGWRMLAPSALGAGVKQSFINDMYDQAESVYSSVFIGSSSSPDKGKGKWSAKASGDKEQHARLDLDSSSPPDFLINQSKSRPTSEGRPTEDCVHLEPKAFLSVRHHSSPLVGSIAMIPPISLSPDSQTFRFPMPTHIYRRRMAGSKAAGDPNAAGLSEAAHWQDQSPRDRLWLAIYLTNLLFTACLGMYLFLFSHPSGSSLRTDGSILLSPSLALVQSFPLFSLLAGLSAVFSVTLFGYLLLLQSSGVRHCFHLITVLPAIVLLACSVWAFSASYSRFSNSSSRAVEQIDHASNWTQFILRTSSIFVALLSLVSLRYLYVATYSRLERTIRVIQVASEVLLLHPTLFILNIIGFGTFVVLAALTLLMVAKLLVLGYAVSWHYSPASDGSIESRFTFLIPSKSSILLVLHTAFVFLWTLAILRGVSRHTIAGTISEWWFHRHDSALGPSMVETQPSSSRLGTSAQLHYSTNRKRQYTSRRAAKTVKSAFSRAVGASIGTICVSSLVLASFSFLFAIFNLTNTLVSYSRRRSTSVLSGGVASLVLRFFLNLVFLPIVAILGGILKTLSNFTLVHAAITGDPFWTSAKEAKDLITNRQGTDIVVGRESLVFPFFSWDSIEDQSVFFARSHAQIHDFSHFVGISLLGLRSWLS